jgi:RNA polymerase sigma-70 factor (ECF subfamily)
MRGHARVDHAARFESLYAARYRDIAGYVRRRVADDDADDVIANVFAVAWRRIDNVPAPPDDRLWLFTVARNSVADHDRSRQRRLRLHTRLAQDQGAPGPHPASSESRYEPVLAAMAALKPAEREALQLVLWDELTHAEAAALLDCSVNAFELRYRRARNAVKDAVLSSHAAPEPGAASSHRMSFPARGTAS